MNQHVRPVLVGLLALMIGFVAFQLALPLWLPGTPLIAFDSVDYFRKALEVFDKPSLATVTGFERPLFCWWIPWLASRLSHPLSLAAFATLSNLWAFGTLVAGLFFYFAGRPQAGLGFAWTLILIFSIEPLRLLTLPHAFMGDFYLTGQILLCEGLLSQFEARRSKRWGVAAGLAFALGVQTKPIFFLWALPRIFSSAVALRNELRARARAIALFLLAGFGCGWLLFPPRVPEFSHELFLHNEVWRQHQFNPNPLWFLKELGSIALQDGAGALIATGLILFAVAGRCLGKKKKALGWDPSLAAVSFCAVFLSLFVVGKDFRTTQFIFVLALAAISRWAAAGIGKERQLRVAIPATLAACVLAVVRINAGHWVPHTFEELGYDQLERVFGNREVSAYVAINSMEYNYTSLENYKSARCGLLSKRELLQCAAPVVHAYSSPFYLGGWGEPGGFPSRFFTADYVVLPGEGGRPFSVFAGSFYASLIRDKLTSGDQAFSNGLREIARLPVPFGIAWLVYKREQPISRKAFQEVLESALSRNPDNVWNEPWRIAVRRLKDPGFDPASPAEVERRSTILKSNMDRIEFNSAAHSLKKLLEGAKDELRNASYQAIVLAPQ